MRKSLNFDLDTKKLKEYYSNNYPNAYNDIKKFLLKNGFEHTQGSGYISKKEMSNAKLVIVIEELGDSLSWLKDCCKTLHYSDVKPVYDGLEIIKEDKTLKVDKFKEKDIRTNL